MGKTFKLIPLEEIGALAAARPEEVAGPIKTQKMDGPCGEGQRTFTAFARCFWRKAIWVHGSGPFALLAHCRALTIMLYENADEASRWKLILDTTGCGGACSRDHEIIQLER